jgi:hypothetical protein
LIGTLPSSPVKRLCLFSFDRHRYISGLEDIGEFRAKQSALLSFHALKDGSSLVGHCRRSNLRGGPAFSRLASMSNRWAVGGRRQKAEGRKQKAEGRRQKAGVRAN